MEEKQETNLYQKILDKAVDKNIPLSMQFELTARCNIRCVHCYSLPEGAKEELSTDEVTHILDELSDEGVLFLTFTGGEILCRDDFFDIARYARKRNFALRLYTNATLITASVADKIRDIEPMTVEISLYATNAKVHDRITGVSGSYSKTRDAILMLQKRGVNIVIKSIIMKENADECGRLRLFANELGTRFVYDYILIPRIDGSTKPLNHCINDFEMNDLLCKNITVNAINEYSLKRLDELPDKTQPICGAAKNGACISPYGEVFPCVTWRASLGNLKEKTFKEIWKSIEAEKIRNLTVGDMKYCANCTLYYHCAHCPGMALLETGDALGLSPAACHAAQLKREAIYSSWLLARSS